VTEHEHDDNCDHDDAHDHGHGDAEYVSDTSPELAAQRLARLNETLAALTVEDLNAHLQRSPEQVRSALTQRLSVRLDPRFIKGGVGRLVRTKIRGLSPTKQVEMAAELTAGLDHESAELLGDEVFEMPTREDLDRLVDHLLESHPRVIVRVYVACTAAADAPVAGELDKLLEDDRLALNAV
jgi:hypothetical protein